MCFFCAIMWSTFFNTFLGHSPIQSLVYTLYLEYDRVWYTYHYRPSYGVHTIIHSSWQFLQMGSTRLCYNPQFRPVCRHMTVWAARQVCYDLLWPGATHPPVSIICWFYTGGQLWPMCVCVISFKRIPVIHYTLLFRHYTFLYSAFHSCRGRTISFKRIPSIVHDKLLVFAQVRNQYQYLAGF